MPAHETHAHRLEAEAGGGGKESSVQARFQRRPLTVHAHSSRYGAPWMITLAVMRATRTRRVGARLSKFLAVGDLGCGSADEWLGRIFMQRRGWRECPLLHAK